jgi:hypothetical protein
MVNAPFTGRLAGLSVLSDPSATEAEIATHGQIEAAPHRKADQ